MRGARVTRALSLAGALALALAAGPLSAGDPSGFDPAAVDQCLAGGPAEGCADAGLAACLDAGARDHADTSEALREQICHDAAHQVWDARLGVLYNQVVAQAVARGIHPEQHLRQAERDWIGFRDARCTFEAVTFGNPDDPDDPARARCLLAETQRQYILLSQWYEAMQ